MVWFNDISVEIDKLEDISRKGEDKWIYGWRTSVESIKKLYEL